MATGTVEPAVCQLCGAYLPHDPCEGCGAVVHVGDDPVCTGIPEEHAIRRGNGGLGFPAFYDEHMPVTLPDGTEQPRLTTSLADWNRNMKEGGWSPNIKTGRKRHRRTIMKTVNGKLINCP